MNLKVSRAPPHGRLSQPALKYESRSKFQSWAGPFYANASGSFMGSSEASQLPHGNNRFEWLSKLHSPITTQMVGISVQRMSVACDEARGAPTELGFRIEDRDVILAGQPNEQVVNEHALFTVGRH